MKQSVERFAAEIHASGLLCSHVQDYVLSVDISPDGAWIVSGSKDRGVQFWDPRSAKAQFMLQGHKNSGEFCSRDDERSHHPHCR